MYHAVVKLGHISFFCHMVHMDLMRLSFVSRADQCGFMFPWAAENRHSYGRSPSIPPWECAREPRMFGVWLELGRSPWVRPRRIPFSGEHLAIWSLLRPSDPISSFCCFNNLGHSSGQIVSGRVVFCTVGRPSTFVVSFWEPTIPLRAQRHFLHANDRPMCA